jgi:hypothetical protein
MIFLSNALTGIFLFFFLFIFTLFTIIILDYVTIPKIISIVYYGWDEILLVVCLEFSLAMLLVFQGNQKKNK